MELEARIVEILDSMLAGNTPLLETIEGGVRAN